MNLRSRLFEQHAGLVRTRELLAAGEEPEWIRIGRNYGKLIAVRQGWWALPGTPDDVLTAWRAGGRLACVSALAHHGASLDTGETLHIELPKNSTGPRRPDVVVHWSSDQANGDRRAVSVEVAHRQASRCRVATGTL
jgi:hypothetical protein